MTDDTGAAGNAADLLWKASIEDGTQKFFDEFDANVTMLQYGIDNLDQSTKQ